MRNEFSVLFSCTESLLAVSPGQLAASIMAPHHSEVLTVHVYGFLVDKECPLISVHLLPSVGHDRH